MAPTAATRARSNKAAATPETEGEVITEAPAKPAKKESLQQLKNRLRNEAEREVLNTHRDEVITITQAKYDEHGLEYVRRLTDEEKAAKTIEELYRKHPNLRPETIVQADPVHPGQVEYEDRKRAVEEAAAAEGVSFVDPGAAR